MSMRQESAISPVGTVEYMAPEVGGRLGWGQGSVTGAPRAPVLRPSSVQCGAPAGLAPDLRSCPPWPGSPTPPPPQVVALPPVDLVINGTIKATDIPPTNEKVDIWALGVTIFELVTGALR